MDPNEAWKVMTDGSRSLDERGEAAMNLLGWLAMEGALPAPEHPHRRAEVVERAKIILSEVLDAAQEGAAD